MTGGKRWADSNVAGRRFRKVFALAVIGVVSVLLVCAMSKTVHAEDSFDGGPLVGRLWESIESGSGIEGILAEEGMVRITSDNIPEWMEHELFGLKDMGQAIANESFELVWFLREGNLQDAASSIRDELASKGWTPCSEDEGGVETFVKKEGVCKWVMAECVQAGEEVAIVLRIRHT